jgi:hypothetical protein
VTNGGPIIYPIIWMSSTTALVLPSAALCGVCSFVRSMTSLGINRSAFNPCDGGNVHKADADRTHPKPKHPTRLKNNVIPIAIHNTTSAPAVLSTAGPNFRERRLSNGKAMNVIGHAHSVALKAATGLDRARKKGIESLSGMAMRPIRERASPIFEGCIKVRARASASASK